MPSQHGDGSVRMTAFEIGYKAFKKGDSGIPSMNKDLQFFMRDSGAWNSNEHDAIMWEVKQFISGWNDAMNEWEVEFFANA